MIVAIPLKSDETFSVHFGASAVAAIFEIDPGTHVIAASGIFRPPGLEPCAWGPWLHELGVTRLLVGGIGEGAREQMQRCGVEVVTGITAGEAEVLVRSWLRGTLALGANACLHGGGMRGLARGAEHGSPCGCRH
jgi:ATP-binding protein involved in chromosome partitioning